MCQSAPVSHSLAVTQPCISAALTRSNSSSAFPPHIVLFPLQQHQRLVWTIKFIMRLISTTTLELHEFFNVRRDEHFPKYAILSHCWTDNEVGYKDFVKKRKLESSGYCKISNACKFARSRGFEWLWVDTWYALAHPCGDAGSIELTMADAAASISAAALS